MELVASTRINRNQVHIAEVQPTYVFSHNAIQIRDLGILTTENQLPTYTDIIQTTPGNSGILNFTNYSKFISLTRYYRFNRQTGLTIPMWYKHKALFPHYNTSGTNINVERQDTPSPGDRWSVLPSNSKRVICEESIQLYVIDRITKVRTTVTNPPIHLDHGTQEIVFDGSITGKTANNNILIIFHTVLPSLSLEYSDKTSINPDYYIIRIDQTDYENVYLITVFINFTPQGTEKIWLQYAKYEFLIPGTQREIISYTPAMDIVDTTISNKDQYRIKSNLDVATALGQHTTIYVRPVLDRNGKIALMEPLNVPKTHPWYIEISTDTFTRTSPNRTYEVLGFEDHMIVKDRTEKVFMPAENMIETGYSPLHVIYDDEGKPTNISITYAGNDVTQFINAIDTFHGHIFLEEGTPIIPDLYTIEYQSLTRYDAYTYLNVNPDYLFNTTNEHISDRTILFYILPKEELDTSKNRSVFHYNIYRDPLAKVEEYQKSVTKAMEYIENNISTLIPDYTKSGYTGSFHPIFLGYVTVTNPFSAKKIDFMDIRRRGGGIVSSDDYHEFIYEDVRHHLDIGHFDGYPLNLENIAIVTLPISILDNIEERLIKYDTYTIRALRRNPNFDTRAYASDFIRRAVRKSVRAGCDFTIVYTGQ